jgi:hypothetical protein
MALVTLLTLAQLFNCLYSSSEMEYALGRLHRGPLLWGAVIVSGHCRRWWSRRQR